VKNHLITGELGIAFQVAKRGDMAGVGRGILIFDLRMYERAKKNKVNRR